MNILFISYSDFLPYKGGVERVTDVLTREFLRRGHHVFYLCGCVKKDISNIEELPVPIFYMDKELNVPFDVNSVNLYKKIQIDLDIDIIIHQYPIIKKSVFFLKNRVRAKVISVVHQMPYPYINNETHFIKYWDSKKIQVKFAKKFFSVFPKLYSCYRKCYDSSIYREIFMFSDKVCLLSDKFFPLIIENNRNIDKFKLIAIGNPNTFEIEEYEDCDLEKKQNIILFVGRITNTQKNIIGFLDMWSVLSKNNLDWNACVVGDGPDLEDMKKYVLDNRIERVCFEGSQKNVKEYYRKAKFICMTSIFEGWGMVLTEGMSYGCVPIVYGSYGAVYDIIDDNKSGCIIKPFDKNEMVNRIQNLIDDKEKLRQSSMEAYIKSKIFSPKLIVDKWISLFNKIVYGK